MSRVSIDLFIVLTDPELSKTSVFSKMTFRVKFESIITSSNECM